MLGQLSGARSDNVTDPIVDRVATSRRTTRAVGLSSTHCKVVPTKVIDSGHTRRFDRSSAGSPRPHAVRFPPTSNDASIAGPVRPAAIRATGPLPVGDATPPGVRNSSASHNPPQECRCPTVAVAINHDADHLADLNRDATVAVALTRPHLDPVGQLALGDLDHVKGHDHRQPRSELSFQPAFDRGTDKRRFALSQRRLERELHARAGIDLAIVHERRRYEMNHHQSNQGRQPDNSARPIPIS